jgi:hypothetical protein
MKPEMATRRNAASMHREVVGVAGLILFALWAESYWMGIMAVIRG